MTYTRCSQYFDFSVRTGEGNTGGMTCSIKGSLQAQVEFIFTVPTIAPVAGMLPIKKQLPTRINFIVTTEEWTNELYDAPSLPRHCGGANSVIQVGAAVVEMAMPKPKMNFDNIRV